MPRNKVHCDRSAEALRHPETPRNEVIWPKEKRPKVGQFAAVWDVAARGNNLRHKRLALDLAILTRGVLRFLFSPGLTRGSSR